MTDSITLAELDRQWERLHPMASDISVFGTSLIARVRELETALRSAVKIADEAAIEWDKAPDGMRVGKILLALAGRVPGYRADTDAVHAALKSARRRAGGR